MTRSSRAPSPLWGLTPLHPQTARVSSAPSLLALGILFAFGLSGCQPPIRETSVENLRHPAGQGLIVRLDRGSLVISEHPGAWVEIEVRRSAWSFSREAARSALETLLVEARPDPVTDALFVTGRSAAAGVWRPGERLGLQLRIAVPEGAAVDARTTAGRIELRGLSGPVRVMTGQGRIRAVSLRSPSGQSGEPIRLRTVRGRIEGNDLEGRVRAESGEGRIRLAGALREVWAVSADGRIEVDARASAAPLRGDWILRTANGSVRLALPRNADAEISILGDRETEDSPQPLSWKRRGPLAVAAVGAGAGARIRLRTGNGTARVRIDDEP